MLDTQDCAPYSLDLADPHFVLLVLLVMLDQSVQHREASELLDDGQLEYDKQSNHER